MNRKVTTIVMLVVVGFVALAQAHVIRMNDGRVFKGRFVGGDKTHVFFQVDGDTIQKFPVASITAIQFQTYSGGDQLTSTESVTLGPRSRTVMTGLPGLSLSTVKLPLNFLITAMASA